MSTRRASPPPPLPPLRACPDTSLAGARDVPGQTLAAPPRSRGGLSGGRGGGGVITKSKPRAKPTSPPPPLPPLRACPDTSLRFRSGTCPVRRSPPPPAPGGGLAGGGAGVGTSPNQNHVRNQRPVPRPLPRSRPSVHVPSLSLRDVPGRTARCPLPLPAGAYNDIINTFQHNYCVSCLPHPANDFFFLCSAIHLVPCLATLRPGPRRTSSQRFSGCAHHKSNS